MHPSVRLLSLERCSLHPSRVLHASTTCRHQVAPRSFPVRQIRYNSSDDPTLTERIRRKIWGTDSPPGLKDPYGGRGVFEQRWSGERQPSQEQEAEPIEQEGEIAPPDAYTEATNWEGLEHIGHLGKWTDLNKKNPADQYIPYGPPLFSVTIASSLSKMKRNKSLINLLSRWTRSRKIQVRQLQEAAHQAAVELCMLHKIKKPLTSITESVGGQYPEQISKMIMDCKVKSDTDWENAIVFPNMRVQHALLHAFKHHVPGSRYRSLSTDKILQKAGVNLDDPQTKSQDKQMELEHKMASSAGDYTTLEFRDPEVKFAVRFPCLTLSIGHDGTLTLYFLFYSS